MVQVHFVVPVKYLTRHLKRRRKFCLCPATIANIVKDGKRELFRVGPAAFAVGPAKYGETPLERRREILGREEYISIITEPPSEMGLNINESQLSDIGKVVGEIMHDGGEYEVVVIKGTLILDEILNDIPTERGRISVNASNVLTHQMRPEVLLELVKAINQKTRLGVRIPDRKIGFKIATKYSAQFAEMGVEWFMAEDRKGPVWFELGRGSTPGECSRTDPSACVYDNSIVVIRRKLSTMNLIYW